MLTVKLEAGMRFVGHTDDGHTIPMDATEAGGGSNSGPRPTEVMLSSLAGCSGMDVIAILRKMRTEPASLEVEVAAERAEERPRPFTRIVLTYAIGGDVPEENVRKAIDLSLSRYCPVANTLNGVAKIETEIRMVAG